MSTNFTNPKDRKRQIEAAEDTAARAAELAQALEAKLEAVEAAPAPPALAMTQEQFTQLLQAVTAKQGSMDTAALKAVIDTAREPIPENKIHHGISSYRPERPDAPNVAQTAPPFRWPQVWYAAVDDSGDIHPLYDLDHARMTIEEITAVNRLVPGTRGKVRFTDGSRQDISIVEERTVGGDVKRLLIGFNIAIFKDRDKRNQIGAIPALCAQVEALAGAAV